MHGLDRMGLSIYLQIPSNGASYICMWDQHTAYMCCVLHISVHTCLSTDCMCECSFVYVFVPFAILFALSSSRKQMAFFSLAHSLALPLSMYVLSVVCVQTLFDLRVSQQIFRCQHTCKHLRLFYTQSPPFIRSWSNFCSLSLSLLRARSVLDGVFDFVWHCIGFLPHSPSFRSIEYISVFFLCMITLDAKVLFAEILWFQVRISNQIKNFYNKWSKIPIKLSRTAS